MPVAKPNNRRGGAKGSSPGPKLRTMKRAPKAKRDYEIEATAYHEAGHAIVGAGLGAIVKVATVKPRGKILGRVRFAACPDDHESELLCTLAGPFAQKRFAPRSAWRSGNRDFDNAKKLVVSRIHGKGTVAQKYLAYMEARAAQVVNVFWIDIEAVAKALLERETMTGREIRAVIRNAQTKRGRRDSTKAIAA
jgi:hypothetical protein